MRKLNKKIVVGTAAAAVVLAGGGVAFAYWTTSGSGTGNATNASANGVVVLHASFLAGLTPGGSAPVSFTADNVGTSSLRVGTVSTVVTASGTCDASWFSVADVVENQTIAAGASGVALTQGGSIVFADSADNQDACKSAIVTLTLTSN